MFRPLIAFLAVAVLVAGCGQQAKTANSSQAIEQAKTMKTVDEQVKFLVAEANAFIGSKQYQDAVNAAQYILASLDKNSQEAKGILEKATAELTQVAQEKVAQAQATANKAMDDMKTKLGTIGK